MAEESDTIEIDTKKLEALIKAFKGDIPSIKIGILNNSNHWQKNKALRSLGKMTKKGKFKKKKGFVSISSTTNAEIGAKHEFGDGKTPIRSFLRMPLSNYLNSFLENAGAFDEASLKKVIEDKSIKTWMKKIAIVAETVIDAAFDSGGWGTWRPSNMKNKKVQMTLVETGQLRKSISSEVK